MRFFKSRNKFFLRNLIVGLVFIGFSFQILAVPQISAQTKPKPATTSAIPQKTITVTPTGTPEQYKVTLPNGTTETGKVLFDKCSLDPTGLCDAVSGAVGGIAGAILSAFKGAIKFIVTKIVLQGLLLVANALGFAFDFASTACKASFSTVGDFLTDSSPGGIPNTTAADVHKFNAFVALDYGIGGVYSGFPKSNSVQNLAQVFQNNVLGIGTAHAQGVGTTDLGDTISTVWSKMRDLAIILMVVALVIIGFMVMLRRRLDPKTVVTATNALPKFAIALVLIVFSFAIAGFFVDFIHLTVGLVQSYFGGVMGGAFKTASQNFGGELLWFPIFTAFSLGTIFNWAQVLCSIGLISPALALNLLFLVLVIEILIRLVLVIVGFYLFWILLKNFAYMVLYTIFAPLFFLLGAIPGFESMTVNWFKRMFVNSIAFPIILFLIYLAVSLILTSNPFNQLSGSVQAPPPIGSNILNIPYLIGLGIIFFATKVPIFLEKVFKIDSFDVKGGMGPGVLAAPIAVPMAGFKAAGNFGKSLQGVQQLRGNVSTGLTGLRNMGWGPKPATPVSEYTGTPMEPGEGQVMGTGKIGETFKGAPEKPGRGASIARSIFKGTPGTQDPWADRFVPQTEINRLKTWASSRGVNFTEHSTDDLFKMAEMGNANPLLSTNQLKDAVDKQNKGYVNPSASTSPPVDKLPYADADEALGEAYDKTKGKP